jgi:hypothetical protein
MVVAVSLFPSLIPSSILRCLDRRGLSIKLDRGVRRAGCSVMLWLVLERTKRGQLARLNEGEGMPSDKSAKKNNNNNKKDRARERKRERERKRDRGCPAVIRNSVKAHPIWCVAAQPVKEVAFLSKLSPSFQPPRLLPPPPSPAPPKVLNVGI